MSPLASHVTRQAPIGFLAIVVMVTRDQQALPPSLQPELTKCFRGHCERSEAIYAAAYQPAVDCFAMLAMAAAG